MKYEEQFINGVYLYEPTVHKDLRGELCKTIHSKSSHLNGEVFQLREEFVTTSAKNVVRGMHFQVPPFDHEKIIYCVSGAILDVVLDLRKASHTYRKIYSVLLSGDNRRVLWLPKGIAHGFLSLDDRSVVVYKTSIEYSASHDQGVLWNSIGFEWPVAEHDIILSERDRKHQALSDFFNPF